MDQEAAVIHENIPQLKIVTNIKTVKAFATEALELKRQRQRLKRELKVVLFRIHLVMSI